MAGNPPNQGASQELTSPHPEVEFALVLARTIDSIRTDPEQLRGAIYELARQKLREQFNGEDASEVMRLTAALEVAIQGVETHSKKDRELQRPLAALDGRLPPMRLDGYHSSMQAVEGPPVDRFFLSEQGPLRDRQFPLSGRLIEAAASSVKKGRFTAPAVRFVVVVAVLLAVAGVILQWTGQFSTRDQVAAPVAISRDTSKNQAQREVAPTETVPPRTAALLPASFGIYAISAGKLYELEPLQARAPDIRIAISAVITTPSRTTVPDGHLKFVVFRRDAPGSGTPDQVDVRVVAKIEQAMNFDSSGKPVLSKTEDNWAIRNISFSYRTSPIKDNPEMYEVQSKDPDTELSPGRYALVIKGQAFDFTVAGSVVDRRHCLGRMAAANGTFYSECQKH
jgi:hypothetical protein